MLIPKLGWDLNMQAAFSSDNVVLILITLFNYIGTIFSRRMIIIFSRKNNLCSSSFKTQEIFKLMTFMFLAALRTNWSVHIRRQCMLMISLPEKKESWWGWYCTMKTLNITFKACSALGNWTSFIGTHAKFW